MSKIAYKKWSDELNCNITVIETKGKKMPAPKVSTKPVKKNMNPNSKSPWSDDKIMKINSKLTYDPSDKSFTFNNTKKKKIFVGVSLTDEQVDHFIIEPFNIFIDDLKKITDARQKGVTNFENLIRIHTKSAGTNTGKTTASPYFVKLLMEYDLVKQVIIAAPDYGTLEESKSSFNIVFAKSLSNGFSVGLKNDLKSAIADANEGTPYKVIFVTNETNKNILNNKKNAQSYIRPDLIIVEEVDNNNACKTILDAPVDMGVSPSGWNPKRLTSLWDYIIDRGIPTFAHTGTTSASHRGESPTGDQYFSPMRPLNSDPDNCRAIRYRNLGLKKVEDAVRESFMIIADRTLENERLKNSLSPATRRVLKTCGVDFNLQRNILVPCGNINGNGNESLPIDTAIKIWNDVMLAKGILNYRIAVFQSKNDILYEYENNAEIKSIDRTNGGLPNTVTKFSKEYLSTDSVNFKPVPTIILVVWKANRGENIHNITDIVFARKSTINEIWRRESQIIGRLKRNVPGIRSHIKFINSLLDSHNTPSLSGDDVVNLVEFLTFTAVGDIYFADSSKNVNGAVDDVMEHVYKDSDIIELYASKLLGMAWKNILETNSRRFIDHNIPPKGNVCQVCSVEENGKTSCRNLCEEYIKNTYGILSEEEIELAYQTALHRHHVNGNHFDNSTENVRDQCCMTHAVTSSIENHFSNRYE